MICSHQNWGSFMNMHGPCHTDLFISIFFVIISDSYFAKLLLKIADKQIHHFPISAGAYAIDLIADTHSMETLSSNPNNRGYTLYIPVK